MSGLGLGLRLGTMGRDSTVDPALTQPKIGNDITVMQTGSLLYVKTALDVAGDRSANRRIQLFANKADAYSSVNNVASSGGINTTFTDAVRMKASSDDNSPFSVNGSYVGGNHGWANLIKITSVNHGITYSDIGLPAIANELTYYPVWIASADIFYLLAYTGNRDVFSSVNSISGNIVCNGKTVSSGYAASAATQIRLLTDANTNESMRNKTRTILVNNKTELPINTETDCKYLVVNEKYDIINPFDELAYIVAHGGEFTANPTWNYANPAFTLDITYIFEDYCVVKIWQKITSYINAALTAPSDYDSLRGVQSAVIPAATDIVGSGSKKWFYLPDVKAATSTQMNNTITNLSSMTAKGIAASDLVNANIPPTRHISMMSTSEDVMKYYSVIGYSPFLKDSTPSKRLLTCGRYWYFSTAIKSYPHWFSPSAKTTLPIGTYESFAVDIVRTVDYTNATSVYWYNEADYALLFIDYHASREETITLPSMFNGKTWELVGKTDGFDIGSSGTLTNSQLAINVDVTGGVGEYAILKVR